MRIWLAQTNPRIGNVNENIADIQDVINCVALEGERGLVVFPELSLTGYDLGSTWPDHVLTSEDISSRIICPPHISAVIGFAEASPDGMFNSATIVGKPGKALTQRKIYPISYPPFNETTHFKRGNHMEYFPIDEFHASVLICNDAWHPTLPYLAALKGANLLIVPANSSEFGTNRAAWPTLIRYYATIYGTYVIFVNRVGSEGDWNFWGGSEVISPTGEQLIKAGGTEEICYVDISLEAVKSAREKLPIMREDDPIFAYRKIGEHISKLDIKRGR